MCSLLYACNYHQVKELILLVLFFGGFLVGVPLAMVVGFVIVEIQKAKRSGVDVGGIIEDARRRAYRRGHDGA